MAERRLSRSSRSPSSTRGSKFSRSSKLSKSPRSLTARRKRFIPKRRCFFCSRKLTFIDYKNPDLLRQFTTEKGKILNCRFTGTCARHQRQLSLAIKRARFVALLPFVGE